MISYSLDTSVVTTKPGPASIPAANRQNTCTMSISVDSNELTGRLNYLESTLTKSRGRRCVMVKQIPEKRIWPEEHVTCCPAAAASHSPGTDHQTPSSRPSLCQA